MESKILNSKLRKIIYAFLFAVIIYIFIFLGNKYASNSTEDVKTIQDFYSNIKSDIFIPITGNKMIYTIKNEKAIIFMGNQNSSWSEKYISELESIFLNLSISKVYYYDINNDKSQKNAIYYDIKSLLKNNLVETDSSSNNLFAPSLYLVDHGKILYYNIDTAAVKNTDSIENFWNDEQQNKFSEEITTNLKRYYLNN